MRAQERLQRAFLSPISDEEFDRAANDIAEGKPEASEPRAVVSPDSGAVLDAVERGQPGEHAGGTT
tara:strand:+ start:369 stop:566 length:198 start_codon:yes stop_codon:yes gene_type:complete